MRISSRPRAALLLIVLLALGALGGTLYALRGRLAAAPFIGSVIGRAQVETPAAGAAQPPAPAPAGADGAAPAPDASEARAEITIDPRRQQLIGVRTVPVKRTSVSPTIRGIGLVRYDETRLADVNLKLEGWIRDLYVDYTGHYVRKGQPLFTLYSPELLNTQNEYLLALKTRDQIKQSQIPDARESSERLVELARQRLDLWDLPPDQFAQLQRTRKPQTAMAFRSPVNGFVIEKQARQGMHVMPGQTLYKIADLSVVWVEADIYEQEVPLVGVGQPAIVTLDAYQGELFHGRVIYIYPYVEEKTRTVKARLEFANRGGRLKPGMYANVELRGRAGTGLTVPVNAVLDSGKQQVVFVAQGDGYFEPRRVTIGRRLGDTVEILKGLNEGEQVATGATFFLDSESQLSAALQGFEAAPAAAPGGGERERLDILFRSQPDPPQTGDNVFEVTVKDPSGQPVADADVSIIFYMAAMPSMNMPAMRNEATLPPAGGGVYRGPGQVMMAGRWNVTINVTRAGRRLGSKQLTAVAR
ncbi:MAG: FixH family protein [Pseudomonadota bacterium]|nr:FixH family protein [Pseudomonadota bacterium]